MIEDSKPLDSAEGVLRGNGQPMAKGPSLQKGAREPTASEPAAGGNRGQIDEPKMVGVLGSDHAAGIRLGILLRWRCGLLWEDPTAQLRVWTVAYWANEIRCKMTERT